MPKFAVMAGVKYRTVLVWRGKDGGFGVGTCLCRGHLRVEAGGGSAGDLEGTDCGG